MEALVYIANCLYLTSYIVQDMLRLRLLSLVGAICLTTYFYTRPEPLMTVVCWNLVFVGINVIQVVRLIADKRLGGIRKFKTRFPSGSARRTVSRRTAQCG